MTKKETTPNAKNLKFDEALKKLEKIVDRLEEGDVPLEESLSLYEEGISLFHLCSTKLEEAKKKVEILTKKGASGKLERQPFEPSEFETSAEEDGQEKEISF